MIIVPIIERFDYRSLVIRVGESDFLRNFTEIDMGKVMSYGFINSAEPNVYVPQHGKRSTVFFSAMPKRQRW
jgi:hypothetical protein